MVLSFRESVGGFDIAASWCGWTNVFQCEINPFCQRVLKYHFPKTILYDDIKQTDFTIHRGTISALSGGFPCQPFSMYGRRKGTADNRFLWDEMFRAILEVKPSWVVAENVYGLLTQAGGMVFERVCADLESAGYEVQPFVIPACAVGAPHRRDRVWIVAYRTNTGIESMQQERKNRICEFETIADTLSERLECRINERLQYGTETRFEASTFTNADNVGRKKNDKIEPSIVFAQDIQNRRNFPTKSTVCGGNDGLPGILDGITFPAWRRNSIEAYGNAIVPQVAYQIFKAINEVENRK
jgi:DNA (cytosine-5)-methyltransferase 1